MNILFFLRGDFNISSLAIIDGNISSDKNGSISGVINGDIKVRGKLTVEKKGLVNGDVYAKEVVIKGVIKGNIYCEGKVYATKKSETHGNIIAREAIIDKESIVKGAISQARPRAAADIEQVEEELSETNMAFLAKKLLPEEPPENWF